MLPAAALPDPELSTSRAYRFARALVRLGLRFYFRTVRLLHSEALPDSGAAVLVVGPVPTLLKALMLIAALERPVHCFVNPELIAGLARGILARCLGMVAIELEGDTWEAIISMGSGLVARGEAIAFFSNRPAARSSGSAGPCHAAATIACQADWGEAEQGGTPIFPVHMFVPARGWNSTESLIYIDTPVRAEAAAQAVPLETGESLSQRNALAALLDQSLRASKFRIRPEELDQFLGDVKAVLLADLEEDWAARPNWRQRAEGFELSGFAAERIRELNDVSPEQLVALAEHLDACREAQRVAALRKLRAEIGGAWLASKWRSWRHRTEAPKLQKMRKQFIAELQESLDAGARTLEAAVPQDVSPARARSA